MPIPYISLPQISLPKTPSWKDVLGYLGSYGTPSTSTMSSNLRRQHNEDASTNALIHNINEAHGAKKEQSEEAAKALTLGNFFDYTNPYFQYYTAPTALGLGLGGLLGGWKGSLLGAAGGAGLGALAKYLVDNDKIHMA